MKLLVLHKLFPVYTFSQQFSHVFSTYYASHLFKGYLFCLVSTTSTSSSNKEGVVLGGIPKIPYTAVFSSNRFKGIDFQIYWLCWHRLGTLCYEGSHTSDLRIYN